MLNFVSLLPFRCEKLGMVFSFLHLFFFFSSSLILLLLLQLIIFFYCCYCCCCCCFANACYWCITSQDATQFVHLVHVYDGVCITYTARIFLLLPVSVRLDLLFFFYFFFFRFIFQTRIFTSSFSYVTIYVILKSTSK